MKRPMVMNTLLANIWDKGLEIYKHILMNAHECKMNAYCKWTKPYETRGKAHERKGSDFVIKPSLKWT